MAAARGADLKDDAQPALVARFSRSARRRRLVLFAPSLTASSPTVVPVSSSHANSDRELCTAATSAVLPLLSLELSITALAAVCGAAMILGQVSQLLPWWLRSFLGLWRLFIKKFFKRQRKKSKAKGMAK